MQFGSKTKPVRCKTGAKVKALLDGNTEPKPTPEWSWNAAVQRPASCTRGCKPPWSTTQLMLLSEDQSSSFTCSCHLGLTFAFVNSSTLLCARPPYCSADCLPPLPVTPAQPVFFLQAVVKIMHFLVRKILQITSYSPGIWKVKCFTNRVIITTIYIKMITLNMVFLVIWSVWMKENEHLKQRITSKVI